MRPDSEFERLGAEAARAGEDTAHRVASRLDVSKALRAERPTTPRWLVGAAVMAAAALVAVVLRISWPAQAPAGFLVGTAAGETGSWVVASADEHLLLDFHDGSTVDLSPLAKLQVEALGAGTARVQLEGQAQIEVKHRATTSWQVLAGPYTVHVTGTKFRVSWNEERQAFSLAMQEGSVRVNGPGLEGSRQVFGGQRLELVAPTPAPSKAALVPAEPALTVAEDAGAPQSAQTPPRDLPKSPQRPVNWQSLAADARYPEAWQAVLALGGPQTVLRSASLDDALALGAVARLTNRLDEARSVYASIVTRAPGSSAATNAHFFLGVLSPASAATHFEAYLQGAPEGDFAAEAVGRLLELALGSGDRAKATGLAQRYLERWPTGPHATVAKQVAGR